MKIQKHQKGSILIISLLLLLVMTILGMSAVSNTTNEEKMAGNLRQGSMAFEVAESALREGENYLAGLTSSSKPDKYANTGSVTKIWDDNCPYSYDSSPSACPSDPGVGSDWWRYKSVQWWIDRSATDLVGSTTLGGATGYYLIEEQDQFDDSESGVSGITPFRVTAMGLGQDGVSTVYLRSIYTVRFN